MTGDIGLGALAALWVAGEGRALAVYRRAVYLTGPGGLVALTTMAVPPGPLHLRCAVLPPCRVGERIRTDGSSVRGPRWELTLDLPTWVGSLPPSHLLPITTVTVDRIAGYAARLGGRGPGLTPEGDDVLAGLLLVVAAAAQPDADVAADTTAPRVGPDASRPDAARRADVRDRLAEVAAGVRTTTIASAFLKWAARGQCIAPAHEALADLAVQGAHATTPACDRLTAIGASSGRALLTGIRLGLQPDLERSPTMPLL